MTNIPQEYILLAFSGLLGITLLLGALSIAMMLTLRSASRESRQLNKEMFGLLRKIEGLTATRREQILKQYDSLLENLSNRLPTAIAAQAGQKIFETESKILSRLAELEPSLRDDEVGRQRMDDLIKNMESLEHTLVALTSDTVKRVMIEGRKSILDDERFADVSMAA